MGSISQESLWPGHPDLGSTVPHSADPGASLAPSLPQSRANNMAIESFCHHPGPAFLPPSSLSHTILAFSGRKSRIILKSQGLGPPLNCAQVSGQQVPSSNTQGSCSVGRVWYYKQRVKTLDVKKMPCRVVQMCRVPGTPHVHLQI